MSAQKKPETRIVKRGNGHSYVLDGEKAPGVTTVLNNGVPKPWLAPWASRTVAEYVMDRLTEKDGHLFADELIADLRAYNDRSTYPKKLPDGFSRLGFSEVLKGVHYGERDAAANRGTRVHDLAERLARGEEIDVPDELTGHVEAYLRFLEEWHPTNALLERVVVHRRWRYMGKLDIIADFPFTPVYDESTHDWHVQSVPSRALLDIKTSGRIYDDVGLQLCGYARAETMLTEDGLTEEPMPEIDWCGAIHVRADGYDVYPFRTGEEVFRAFLYVKQVAEFFSGDDAPVKSLKGDALSAPDMEVTQ